MRLLQVASKLDVDSWLRGLFSAGISGGAAAISSGTLVTGLAPETFSFYTWKFYAVVFGMFISQGIVSMAKFLQAHPLPEMKTVTTGVAVTEQAGEAPKTVTTVTETHQEPK